MGNDKAVVLKIENLTKEFSGLVANDHISMEVRKHEIHALCGENGAGKSTFCKMLTGVYHPDDGEIYVNGEKRYFIHRLNHWLQVSVWFIRKETW